MSDHHFHAVVWIDHHEARIFYFSVSDANEIVVRPKDPTRHIHRKANTIGSGHAPEDPDFLQRVTDALAEAGAILVLGPATEKLALLNHIDRRAPWLKSKIRGLETADHPTDGEILALARRFFKDDHMEPPRVQ
jgi:hypothetical protein